MNISNDDDDDNETGKVSFYITEGNND